MSSEALPLNCGIPLTKQTTRTRLFERRVIELKRVGYTNNEIADVCGWNIRRVQRFFKDLHESLQEDGEDPS